MRGPWPPSLQRQGCRLHCVRRRKAPHCMYPCQKAIWPFLGMSESGHTRGTIHNRCLPAVEENALNVEEQSFVLLGLSVKESLLTTGQCQRKVCETFICVAFALKNLERHLNNCVLKKFVPSLQLFGRFLRYDFFPPRSYRRHVLLCQLWRVLIHIYKLPPFKEHTCSD